MPDNWIPDDLDTANVPLTAWEFIYSNGGWLESGSGPGSTVANTSELITWLVAFINANSCTSILDAGCGDMQWIPQVLTDITYTGIDWVSSICNNNKTNYEGHTFLEQDITDSSFSNSNTYDIIICKDVLHHAYDDADQIINNIENISATHKIFIVPTTLQFSFNDKITEAGYTLTHTYTGDEEKDIYVKSA